MDYTSRERTWLSMLAAANVVGLNGVFLWAVMTRPDALASALQNPVAAAFIAEAFGLVGVLAYLLRRWGVSRTHWAWFVLLSVAGGIGFALPVVLLRHRRQDPQASPAGRVV